jgi:hypothetical protein
MGGAFSAVADDASAIFWNPAGLSQIGSQEVMATQADLYGIGIQDNFVAFALPVTTNQTAAVGWYRSAFDDDELGFGENRFDLSYAVRARSWLSVGGTVKYLTRATDLDGVDVASGSGRGLDLGLMATPWKGLRLGLVGQDVWPSPETHALRPRTPSARAGSWRSISTIATTWAASCVSSTCWPFERAWR